MYGKPVHGHMHLTYMHHFHGLDVAHNQAKEIDGTTEFMFDLPDHWSAFKRSKVYLFNNDGWDETLTVVVHVTESLTGLTYNNSIKISVVKSRYKLDFVGYPKVLRPSLTFKAELKVSTYDDKPLTRDDLEETVTLTVTQLKQGPYSWKWDASGVFLSRTTNSSDPTQEIEMLVAAEGIASFKDGKKMLQLYSSYSSPSKSYIQIQRPHLPLQVGVSLQLPIQSNFPLKSLQYLVIARGQVVSAGSSFSPSLTLIPEESWAPQACVIVHCMQANGEIVNNLLELPITQALKNKVSEMVSLSWSKGRVKPAEEVSLTVSVAEPNSLVGILVVDRATHRLDSHNDITREIVLEELAKFGMNKEYLPSDLMTRGDPYSIFTSCDLVVLTDAKLNSIANWLRPEFPGEVNSLMGEDRPYMDQETRERWNFPETWLWLDINTGDSTTAELTLTVPDSITSWIATAFVMSEDLGLGIIERPVELTVFQDFFLSLKLPAYIIRGELLVVEVTLFNYQQENLEVTVIVAESDNFEFVTPDNEGLATASMRQVFVEKEEGATVLFPIKPLVLGEISISVEAISYAAYDAVVKMVLVKPEGIEQTFSKTIFLELDPSEASDSKNIYFTFPEDVVEGSERAHVTADGDILGPSITGLESLIQMPYGCGEQNMIHFAPNIYVLQYLANTGQANQDMVAKATSYMMQGYEGELSYRRYDGSFSAFGDGDSSGSTWLSAFVLRCFLQARPFISIESVTLQGVAGWLAGQQGVDGRFLEPGRVIHTELQGGLDSPVSLTAYVLMALLEDGDYARMYADQVSGAQVFLETKLTMGNLSDYSLCLVGYALSLANSEHAEEAMNQLMARAEMRDGVPYWSSSKAGISDSWQPRSSDIEMAAYLMLSLHKQSQIVKGFPLMKWLSQQRNHLGGYGSTQDTVVGLQALAKYAAIGGAHNINLKISVKTDSSDTLATFKIDHTNYLVHQTEEIEIEENLQFEVTAKGRGFALFQLNVFYNLESQGFSRRRRDTTDSEAFDLDVNLEEIDMYSVHLSICTSLEEGMGLDQTGMAIMEVGLLSGFSLVQVGIQIDDVVKRVETPPGKVILYLDSVGTEEQCFKIPLVMEYKVAQVQDATVVIYDYYEPRRRTKRTYTSFSRREMSLCSFCGVDCSECMAQDPYDMWSSGTVSFSKYQYVASGVCALLILIVFGL
ncbi:CD109 antigen [Aplochiton taeniatus]